MDANPFSATELVMLACAPMLMVVVSLFERRWGPVVAGVVAAAPLTALIGLLLVHSDLGPQASHEMALRMSGFVPAQVGMAMLLSTLVRRTGFVPALLAGVLTYGSLAVLCTRLPVGATIAASGLLLLVAGRLVRPPATADGHEASQVTAGWAMITLRAGVSLGTALGLLVMANLFGPAAGGAVGAFPAFTVTLCSFVVAAGGPRAVSQVLAGMVRGLPAYFAFIMAFAVTGPHLGAFGASGAGTLASICCYLAAAWASARRRREAGSKPIESAERHERVVLASRR